MLTRMIRNVALIVLLLTTAGRHESVDAFAPHLPPTARQFQQTLQMALDEQMEARLDGITRSYQALTERLGDPDVIADSNLLRQVMSDRSQSEEVVLAYEEYCSLKEELEGAKELFQESDAELKEMARAEMKEIEPKMAALEQKITILLLPKDPNDSRNVMLEIRAGTGGSEANIFAGMYTVLVLLLLYFCMLDCARHGFTDTHVTLIKATCWMSIASTFLPMDGKPP